ncbi:Leucine rich repeat/Leucine Rich Repeat [Novymonas esmeraldas]|uniref:Leucine rich repeat/Leucine Rich Repeat n=1 Tax=Novymonas esmeraldas TaxID=1808958 RepID=A0AAW0EJZ0_9TRYP
MSSVDISSTNDVTSTAASDTNGSFVTASGGAHQHGTIVLTTDSIIRECIKQGFYRNPICNEKLYLHNRGYDAIAPTAFEPYTDVKVLWLEGNGLSSLPCGSGYTQVRPPVRLDPFEAEYAAAEAAVQHVDPNATAPPLSVHPPDAPTPNRDAGKAAALPLAADVAPEDRDAFSSLYPTVRQLYLHNNIFRAMPDLSRFERLDAVNLSGNFFTAVEPHCAAYDAAAQLYQTNEAAADARVSPSKSLQREQEAQRLLRLGGSASHDTHAPGQSAVAGELTVVATSEEARRQRAAQLERQRRTADAYSLFCPHDPLPEREEAGAEGPEHRRGSLPSFSRQPPPPAPEYRNPFSSLRTLNLAGNRLESFEDCLGLLCYRAVAVLDLSHNHITDGDALLLILERMPRLQSLKLSGNPLVRTLTRYRKRVLSRCKGLLHLDDRPVFTEERRLVTAWAIGGDDGEEKERHAMQLEKGAAEKKRLDDFRRLLSQHQRAAGTATTSAAPHEEYINAITTVAALSAAADTANSHRRGPSRRGGRQPRPRLGRSAASDPDSSPTSSDSEEEETETEAEAEDVAFAGQRTALATATRIIDTAAGNPVATLVDISPLHLGRDGDGAVQHTIAALHENKPPRPASLASQASSPPQRQQDALSPRVLSSNQRVVNVEQRDGGGGGHDDDDVDIFVPGAA